MSASNQALEALRRADEENRVRATEILTLRQRLADSERAAAAAEEARDRAESRALAASAETERQVQALNVVLKEVTAVKESLRHARAENARLKENLDVATTASREMRNMLAAKSVSTTIEGAVAHSGAVLYMQHCYNVHADPDLGILRSLFERASTINASGASFQQLAVLLDVVRMAPDAVANAVAIDVTCSGDNVAVVADLVSEMRHVLRLTARNVDSSAVSGGLAGTLLLAEHVREVVLPGLRVDDDGLAAIFKTLAQRQVLAAQQPNGHALLLKDLDISQCRIENAPAVFESAALPCLARLDVSGIASFDRPTLRGLLTRCPAVTVVSARQCPKLGADVCDVINAHSMIREVDLTGSLGVAALRLQHVQVLRTSLQAVAVLNCPELVELPTPALAFQLVEFSAPNLESIALHQVTLAAREAALLTSSTKLRNVAFTNCRVSSLDVFLNKMRRLEVISLNGCKGVTDTDVRCFCASLTSVDLTDNFCVTDKAMTRFAELSRLEELTLKRCANVTDTGLLALEAHESLRYLNVLGTKRVTVLSLARIADTCRSLRHVVHETFVCSAIRVDRDDDEEAQRKSINDAERHLHSRMSQLSLGALQPSSASPADRGERPHSPRATSVASAPRLDL